MVDSLTWPHAMFKLKTSHVACKLISCRFDVQVENSHQSLSVTLYTL